MTGLHIRPLSNERGWFITDPTYPFETFIGGDEAWPSQAFVELTERALSEIDTLVARAKAYLDSYVYRQQFADGAEWGFEGITAGRNPTDASSDLWLEFTIEGDIYGFWATRSHESEGRFYFVEFRRIQH
jgi:hypothetical protein